jgi:hypothetical protein
LTESIVLIWTAWNNGKFHSSGAGYGFKVSIQDRDRYFNRAWKEAKLVLLFRDGSKEEKVNIAKPSFWSDRCHEIISKQIGLWLMECGLAPWPSRSKPKLQAVVLGAGRFELRSPRGERI